METIITERGQTSVPAVLRRKYHLQPHSKLVRVDMGSSIHVVPVSLNPIAGLRGLFRGRSLTARLLQDRHAERARER